MSFCIIKIAPGDYFDQYRLNPQIDKRIIERQRREAGLDKPVLVQYILWLKGVCFDLRFSRERRMIIDFEALSPNETYEIKSTADWKIISDAKSDRKLYISVDKSFSIRFNNFDNPNMKNDFPQTDWSNFNALELDIEQNGNVTNMELNLDADKTITFRKEKLKSSKERLVFRFEEKETASFHNVKGLSFNFYGVGEVKIDNIRLVVKGLPFSLGFPNFGYSFAYHTPVFSLMMPRLKNTFILSLCAIIFTWICAIPIGIYCAVRQYSFFDKILSVFSFIGMSVPSFFFALLLLYIVTLTYNLPQEHFLYGILPIGGLVSTNNDSMSALGKFVDILWHLILPVLVLGMSGMAGLQRLMRGNLLETLRTGYITTARSKGLSEHSVIIKHAVRNAINPLITIFGYTLPALLSGAALIEIVFAYPGIGLLMLDAVRSYDLYVVMGSLLLSGFLLIVGNIIADVLLAWVDPRIRFR